MRSQLEKSIRLLLPLVLLLAGSLGCKFLVENETEENNISVEDIPIPPDTEEPSGATSAQPQPSFIISIHMVDENNGWAIGDPDADIRQVYLTGNGGFTWKNVTPPEGPPVEAGKVKDAVYHFMNDNTAWISYFVRSEFPDTPIVWYTTDGGQTWHTSDTLPGTDIGEFYLPAQMVFSGPSHGWMRITVGAGMSKGYIVILHTSDGGATWDRIVDPYIEDSLHSCSKSGMTFFNPSFGWITRECKGLYSNTFIDMTEDGGTTWESVTLPLPPDNPDALNQGYCDVYSPSLFSPQKGALAVMCKSYQTEPAAVQWYFYSTTDGGNTWDILPFAGGEMLFINQKVGWALGDELSVTVDGGQTWMIVGLVLFDSQFNFISEEIGWIVEYTDGEYALKRTDDGGLTWGYILPEVIP